ncbi:MAG: DUF2802 domain-containing protein [Methylococcaceae bacterium]
MNNPLIVALIIEGVTIVIMFAALFWLVRVQLKLKHDCQVLKDIVQGNSNDISGLCSAALTVDSRIAAVDSRIAVTDGYINDLAAKLAEVEQSEQSTHPYSGDIRKVRSGASVDELMRNSGLSHDEAALLIRLHGSKTQL